MAASVRLGLAALDPASTGVLVCPADHPLVLPGTIEAIVRAHRERADTIVIPSYRTRRGHPTLFPRAVIASIFSSPTLRDVIADHAVLVRLVEVHDEGVILDLDTPDDYERMKERFP